MADTQQAEPIRLVKLEEVAPNTSEQRVILALAAESKIRLYIPVPSGKSVYASNAKLSMSNIMTPAMQWKVDEAKRRGELVITNPTLRQEITFLALAPRDAQSLQAARVVRVQQFRGGLRLSKTETNQGALTFVPVLLYLIPSHVIVDHRPWTLRAGELEEKVEWRSVFISENDVSKFKEQLVRENDDPQKEDPFDFRLRAPGVFLLYVAAKHFFGESPPDIVNQEAVKRWFIDQRNENIAWAYKTFDNYKKLATVANRVLAYKIITTEHDLKKTNRKNRAEDPLDLDSVTRASEYRIDNYASDRLCLVAMAVNYWKELTNSKPAAGSNPSAAAKVQLNPINKLRQEIRRWGIRSVSEQNAIVSFVIWPKLAADYEKQ